MRRVQKAGWGGTRAGAGRPGGPSKVVRLPLAIAELVHGLANGRFRPGVIAEAMAVDASTAVAVPLMASRVACGFPSPASDDEESPLNFNELLVVNPPATFAVKVIGESMTGAGIFPGDIAVVDRSLTPVNGSIVLALLDNEFTLKRYCRKNGGPIVLRAENVQFPEIVIEEHTAFEVWGVVKHAIRML